MPKLPSEVPFNHLPGDQRIIDQYDELMRRRGFAPPVNRSDTDSFAGTYYQLTDGELERWIRKPQFFWKDALILVLGLNPDRTQPIDLEHSTFREANSTAANYLWLLECAEEHRLLSTRDSVRTQLGQITSTMLHEWVKALRADEMISSPLDANVCERLAEFLDGLPTTQPPPYKLTEFRARLEMNGESRKTLDELMDQVSEQNQEGCLQIIVAHYSKNGRDHKYTGWVQETLFLQAIRKRVQILEDGELVDLLIDSKKAACRYIDHREGYRQGYAFRQAKSHLGRLKLQEDVTRLRNHLFPESSEDSH